ncbi:hypothetical protein Tco_0878201 [Tanacetum coccineum]|uniref:Uncharacterized protein n=1 Tax=Tanacetum coccineum TaxID=301880 RepID=A0ABQ5BX93_9ASTR
MSTKIELKLEQSQQGVSNDVLSESTQTVSALKLLALKTGEYNLWSMRMEQYLTFTDHALWEVIVNGDSPVASASAGTEGPIPHKTAE